MEKSKPNTTKAHTHTHPFNGPFSGTTRVSRYQKGKTSLDFTEARESEWQLAICKSASRSRQITMPVPHHSFFTGRMPFLPPNQQRQSTEGKHNNKSTHSPITNQKKCTATQNKLKPGSVAFYNIWPGKQSGSILKRIDE